MADLKANNSFESHLFRELADSVHKAILNCTNLVLLRDSMIH